MGDNPELISERFVPRRWVEDLAAWATLAAASLWFLGSFGAYVQHHDLTIQDESSYLRLALDAHVPSDLPAALAPVYCVWLRLLNVFTGDPISTYYLSGYLCSMLVPLLWYGLARSFRIAPLWAGLTALAWLYASVNLDTVRVGNFACLIMWGGVIASRGTHNIGRQWMFAASGLVIASFVRPELFLATLILMMFGAYRLGRAAGPAAALGALAVPALMLVLLISLFGVPIDGPRAAIAWHQHLAYWIAQKEGVPASDWGDDFDNFLVRRGLYTRDAISFAWRHPQLFSNLVASNLSELVLHRTWDTLAPAADLQRRSHGLIWLPLLLSFVAGVVWRYRHRTSSPREAPHWPSVAVLGLSALVVLPACLLLHPWSRYVSLAWAAGLLIILPREEANPAVRPAIIAALGIALFAALMPREAMPNRSNPKEVESIVRLLRSRTDGVPIAVFGNYRHFADYLMPPGVHVGMTAARSGFASMLQRDQPGAIVLMQTPKHNTDLMDDADFRAFLATPSRFGFSCGDAINSTVMLCTAQSLLPANASARRETPLMPGGQ